MRWEKGSKFHGSDKAIPSPGSHDLQEKDKRVSASSQVYFDYHDMVPEQYRWLEKDLAAVNRHWDWLCTRHGIWGNQFWDWRLCLSLAIVFWASLGSWGSEWILPLFVSALVSVSHWWYDLIQIMRRCLPYHFRPFDISLVHWMQTPSEPVASGSKTPWVVVHGHRPLYCSCDATRAISIPSIQAPAPLDHLQRQVGCTGGGSF